jgi:hypothetical protein
MPWKLEGVTLLRRHLDDVEEMIGAGDENAAGLAKPPADPGPVIAGGEVVAGGIAGHLGDTSMRGALWARVLRYQKRSRET